MKNIVSVLFLAIAMFAGCAQQDRRFQQLAERNVELEQRVSALEQENKLLKAEVESLRMRRDAAFGKAAEEFFSQKLAELLSPHAENALAKRVESLIQRAVEDKLGSQAEIQSMFQQIAEQQTAERRRGGERGTAPQAWRERTQEWQRRRMETLARELGLDDAQREQVAAVEAQTGEAARAMMAQMSRQGVSALTNLASVVQDLSTRHEEALKKILTEEQVQAYKNRPDNLLTFLTRLFQAGREPPPPLPAAPRQP